MSKANLKLNADLQEALKAYGVPSKTIEVIEQDMNDQSNELVKEAQKAQEKQLQEQEQETKEKPKSKMEMARGNRILNKKPVDPHMSRSEIAKQNRII